MPKELPPRTRRIQPGDIGSAEQSGTTSAHAENTESSKSSISLLWNYLRARGEYIQTELTLGIDGELPPRTRRILDASEATIDNPVNYLRARGEYAVSAHGVVSFLELPPRTRRILDTKIDPTNLGGTTSAHAENTP